MAEGTYDQLWDVAWDQAAAVGPGFRSRYRLLLRLLQRFGAGPALLDVGAGRGHFLTEVHRCLPKVQLYAHENSAGSLERLGELSFLQGVLSGDLGTEEAGTYSSIVCSEVLEHIHDDRAALDSMTRLLAPGGRLFLTVPLRSSLWTPLDEAVGHQRRYERGQLEALCEERGLEVELSLAVGAPFYNTYYRLLGSKPPDETARHAGGLIARVVARGLTELFSLETHWSSPWGGRGALVARKPGLS